MNLFSQFREVVSYSFTPLASFVFTEYFRASELASAKGCAFVLSFQLLASYDCFDIISDFGVRLVCSDCLRSDQQKTQIQVTYSLIYW